MEYKVRYKGWMKLRSCPTAELRKMLEETFENCSCETSDGNVYRVAFEANNSTYDSYDEDMIYETLWKTEELALDGEIKYADDDDCYWRFKFRNGKWKEEAGHVCYESDNSLNKLHNRTEFIGQLIDICQDYLDNALINLVGEDMIICGDSYDMLADRFYVLLRDWKVIP